MQRLKHTDKLQTQITHAPTYAALGHVLHAQANFAVATEQGLKQG